MKTKLLLLVAFWLSIATQPTAQSIFVAGALASTTHLNAHTTSPIGLPPFTGLTLNCATPGILNSLIPNENKQTIEILTLTGAIDKRDFETMNNLMPALKVINLQDVQIAAYDKSPVNTIPTKAFAGKTKITTVVFPKSLTAIAPEAFRGCSSLSGELKLPEGLTEVELYSFAGCEKLQSLILPSTVEAIEANAFAGCVNLSGELKFPNKLKMIHNSAFEGCKGFTGKLDFTKTSVSDIGANAFKGCEGFNGVLNLSDNLRVIGNSAFEGCKGFKGNITIPALVSNIGANAFKGCEGFDGTITLSSGLKQIAPETFSGCTKIKSINFNNASVHIQRSAFAGCVGLTGDLIIPETVPVIEEKAFENCSGLNGIVTIPNSITVIRNSTFAGCKNIKTLNLPISITGIGSYAFGSCTALESINVPYTNPSAIRLGLDIFQNLEKTHCKLHVPFGTKSSYISIDQWKDFTIVEPGDGFTISNDKVILEAVAPSEEKVTVATKAAWIAVSSDNSWLEVGTSGSILTIKAKTDNIGLPRKAYVTVSAGDYPSKMITVIQKSKDFGEDSEVIPLSEYKDNTAPVVDQKTIKVKVSPSSGKTLYFRFMPIKDEAITFVTKSDYGSFTLSLYNKDGIEILDENNKKLSTNYNYNGNPNNSLITLANYGVAGNILYLGITPNEDCSDIVPMSITGGDLQSFTLKNASGTNWGTVNDWNWGVHKVMPQSWNMGTIDGSVTIDANAYISYLTLTPNAKVTVAGSANLNVCNTLVNKGTINNSGTILVNGIFYNGNIDSGGKVVYAGKTTNENNGTIKAAVFAPITFDSRGGSDVKGMLQQWGTLLRLPAPIKEGYIFEGWHVDATLKDDAIANNSPMPLNMLALYAKWEKHPKVSISDQDGVTNITTTSASITSKIDNIGIPNLFEYGIVWSTNANPTTDASQKIEIANRTVNTPTISNLTGLISNTTYYVRAYAKHKCGDVYGNEVSFTTQAIPVIEWTPSDITYGMKIGRERCNAEAFFNKEKIEGTFTYNVDTNYVPKAGKLILELTFKPSDKTRFCEIKEIREITVAKATPVINWENPLAITYGTLLTNKQLNALATHNGSAVLGTYNYDPTFDTPLTAGEKNLSVEFTPTDQANYVEKVSKTVRIVVNPATPEITWATPAPIVYGTPIPAEYLKAKATAMHNSAELNGTFTYNHQAGETLPCLEHDLTVSFVAIGSDGKPDPNYTATNKTVKLVVTQATPVISWDTPAPIAYGTPLGANQLKASAKFKESVLEGTFTYSSKTGEILLAGTKEITATFAPKDDLNFKSATQKVTLTINKAKLINSKPSVVVAKLYDGNTNAEITNAGTLTNVVKADIGKVAATATAKYDNATVGKNKVITVTYLISGEASNNYVAPDSYIINGAAISEKIRLKELKVAQAGCEGEKITVPYTVESGEPTEYLLTFSDNAAAAGFKNTSFAALPSNAVTFDIPSKLPDGIYTASLKLRDGNGIASDLFPFQFTINVSSDIIITKFGSVVLINNKEKRYTDYQWFKDGSSINGATKQFYKDPSGLKGTYTAQLKTRNGETLNTCPKKLSLQPSEQANLNVYPNPVKAGQPCSIKLSGFTDQELADAVLVVYNMQGSPVYTSHKLAQDNTITLSGVDGVYMGRISISNSEPLTFKIIMAN